jgi:hypothetical protein
VVGAVVQRRDVALLGQDVSREAERTRIPSLRGVGVSAVLSDLTSISFTSAPWTVTSPCMMRILSVPGLEGSEKAIWVPASSARRARTGASASSGREEEWGMTECCFHYV